MPIRPVAYPAFFIRWATVTVSAGIGSCPSGFTSRFPRMAACPPCFPVIRQQRDGAHTVAPAYAWVNRTPSAASRSMCGVLIFVCPKHPRSPYPRSSARMKMTFGFGSAAAAGATNSAARAGSRKRIDTGITSVCGRVVSDRAAWIVRVRIAVSGAATARERLEREPLPGGRGS